MGKNSANFEVTFLIINSLHDSLFRQQLSALVRRNLSLSLHQLNLTKPACIKKQRNESTLSFKKTMNSK